MALDFSCKSRQTLVEVCSSDSSDVCSSSPGLSPKRLRHNSDNSSSPSINNPSPQQALPQSPQHITSTTHSPGLAHPANNLAAYIHHSSVGSNPGLSALLAASNVQNNLGFAGSLYPQMEGASHWAQGLSNLTSRLQNPMFLSASLALSTLQRKRRSGTNSVTSSRTVTPPMKLDMNLTGDESPGTTLSHKSNGARVGSAVPQEKKDATYWERRRKNNEAAKRSRDTRRHKEEEIAMRANILEQENLELRAQVSVLKNETARLQFLLLTQLPATQNNRNGAALMNSNHSSPNFQESA